MKSTLTGITFSFALTGLLGLYEASYAQQPVSATPDLTASKILEQTQTLTAAQMESFAKEKRNPLDWIAGTMWAGIAEFSAVSQRPLDAEAIWQMGEKANWKPIYQSRHPFHADDDCIGQAYLDAYARTRDPKTIAPIQKDMDALAEHINATAGDKELTWSWCDALFMAPPVMARLSSLTGDPKYLDAMDKEWWKVSDQLYDPVEHLYYRDSRFFNSKTKNGHKVFWARGNGWVFGGLARVLSHMPNDYPTRPKYERQFREMATKLLSVQGQDGAWRTSLLDAAEFPAPESSGTAFYCYGMAWGVNIGLLPRETYAPAAVKAWNIVMANRRPDGLPGWVQRVGDRPSVAKAGDTQLYTSGSIAMAGAEMMKLVSSGAPLSSPALGQ